MVIHGDWNIPAFVAAKMDFTVARVPVLFKNRVVWAGSHQFYLPAQRAAGRKRGARPPSDSSNGSATTASPGPREGTSPHGRRSPGPGVPVQKAAILVDDTPYWRFIAGGPQDLGGREHPARGAREIFLGTATPKDALGAVNAEIKRTRL